MIYKALVTLRDVAPTGGFTFRRVPRLDFEIDACTPHKAGRRARELFKGKDHVVSKREVALISCNFSADRGVEITVAFKHHLDAAIVASRAAAGLPPVPAMQRPPRSRHSQAAPAGRQRASDE